MVKATNTAKAAAKAGATNKNCTAKLGRRLHQKKPQGPPKSTSKVQIKIPRTAMKSAPTEPPLEIEENTVPTKTDAQAQKQMVTLMRRLSCGQYINAAKSKEEEASACLKVYQGLDAPSKKDFVKAFLASGKNFGLVKKYTENRWQKDSCTEAVNEKYRTRTAEKVMGV
jgi:hypothetical protein